MKNSLKTILLAVVTCWTLGQPSVWADEAARSIRGADVAAADQAPEAKQYLGGKPGGQGKVARTFEGQPPVIPHAVANFDAIDLEENQCLSCHGPEVYKKKKAPEIGESHFFDREGKKLNVVYSGRYNCVQCHVPQVDAPPLVGNEFHGYIAASKAKNSKR